MSERLGHLALGGQRQHVFLGEEIAQRREYSEETARQVDEEIKTILDESYERASSTLKEYREALDRVADALLAREEILGEEVAELTRADKEEGQECSREESVLIEA
jgi:cell division protease FtsH